MSVSLRLSRPHGITGQALFGAAIFLAAFLIFLIQPMVGKRILPWFGGTPAVWTLCLAVYQTTLFLGYAYAHLLIRFASPSRQLAIHGASIGIALLFLPVLPGDGWLPSDIESPSLDVLAILIANVALPFMVLASTGPLVQAWFVRRHPGVSPYPLYALSNVGSLAALLSYPFVLEPRLPLSETGTLWSIAFAVSGIAVIACALLALRAQPGAGEAVGGEVDQDFDRSTPARVALWLLLPACAVVVLMAVTSELSLEVASVPFLWILPLATYLLTFIFCFGSERAYRRAPFVIFTIFAVAITLASPLTFALVPARIVTVLSTAPGQIASYCALLFGVGMVMHGEIYRLRPPPRLLTGFYLCVSAGGALGGLFVGIAAPALFDDYDEFPLGLAFAWILLLWVCAQDPSSAFRRNAPHWRWVVIGLLTLAILGNRGWVHVDTPLSILHQERNFFGVLRIEEKNVDTNGHLYSLRHGSTLHGAQFQKGAQRAVPTTYYGRATTIGLVMSLRDDFIASRVGVIGLGVGTMAAYGRQGDRFRFYEIDPAVVRIASNGEYFDYLSRSRASIEMVLGDARISLAREQARGAEQDFDILVLDAFSSDAVPTHLLTREAFDHYTAALAPGGLLAVHVSNRYFDLMPLVARQGMEAGMHSLMVKTADAQEFRSVAAKWVLLCRDSKRIEELSRTLPRKHESMGLHPAGIRIARFRPRSNEPLQIWTDDFSDLFSLLKP